MSNKLSKKFLGNALQLCPFLKTITFKHLKRLKNDVEHILKCRIHSVPYLGRPKQGTSIYELSKLVLDLDFIF